MSLKIAVKSADQKAERITVHTAGHHIDQIDYRPNKTSYDDDVTRMSIKEFSNT